VVNLKDGSLKSKKQIDTTDRYAFMGDPSAFDLAPDIIAGGKNKHIFDSVYIGKTFKASQNWSGKMHRILTNGQLDPGAWTYSTLFDPAQPVLVQPTITRDDLGKPWVIFGTGRFFSSGTDSDQVDVSSQALYGIKEGGPGGCWDNAGHGAWKPSCTSVVLFADLTDATGVAVFEGGCVGSACSNTTSNQTIFDLAKTIQGGWFLNLTAPGERVLSKVTLLAGVVLVPSYTPTVTTAGSCETLGKSNLYAAYYQTGTAFASINNTQGPLKLMSDNKTVRRKTEDDVLGEGIATEVAVIVNEKTNPTFISNNSTGNMISGAIPTDPRRKGVKIFLETTE
jgi:Tfp pilus tip-associated adhesin PilY1